MKKIFVFFLISSLFLISNVLVSSKKFEKKSLEEAIDAPARDYFDKYVSANASASAYKVTLEMLREANKNGENYNLKSLEGCDAEKTEVIVTVDYATGKVAKTEIKLNCGIF